MEKVIQVQHLLLRSRRLSLLVLGLTLAILAGAILLTTLQVREKIREQIAGRDSEVLNAVASREYTEETEQDLAGSPADPASQLTVVLKASRLKGVIGARLYDAEGAFVQAFPPDVLDGRLNPLDLAALKNLRPVSRFHQTARMSELFFQETAKARPADQTVPLLEVNVPLHVSPDGQLAGVAQFLIEGHSIAAEFARLDRHLALQAAGTFVAGGGILVLAIGWAFRRLRHAHQLLAERTENLIRANQELALAAKTSALGAVAAHLIHGLKNPLAGLQTFVADRNAALAEDSESDWQQAVASTRRMQTMINEVVRLLREEQAGVSYEVALDELGEIVSRRVQSLARERGVEFTMQLTAAGVLPNRVANLVALILANLAQNALEATPASKAVCLSVTRSGRHFVFEVRDGGPGFPDTQTPFAPCRSAKEGGSGIGLALCKQLANHLGATLELKSNMPDGCVFALSLPAALCAEKTDYAPLSADR